MVLRIRGSSVPPDGYLVPQHQLPPGYSKFLGDVIAQWAIVEHVMASCAYVLLRVPQNLARIVVREPRASDRMDMIRELMEARKFTTAIDMDKLKKKVVEAERQRNILAHSVWCVLSGTEQVFIIRTAGSWRPPGIGKQVPRRMVREAVPWTLADFKEPHIALIDAINGLFDLQEEIVTARGPWPGRLP